MSDDKYEQIDVHLFKVIVCKTRKNITNWRLEYFRFFENMNTTVKIILTYNSFFFHGLDHIVMTKLNIRRFSFHVRVVGVCSCYC